MSLQHWFQTEGETIDFPHEQRWIDAVDRRQGVQIFTPPWALQLIAIQERLVSRVERLIEEQTSRRSSVGTLHTLGDGAIPLAIPIMFSKEEDQEGVSLSVDELGVYVWGETDHEALSELTRQITRLWTDLEQAPEAELGPALIRTKNVLRSMVTADAKNIQRQRS